MEDRFDVEEFMYRLLEKLSMDNAIIIRGALITKLILEEAGCAITRQTRDIDVDWVGTRLPATTDVVRVINKSLDEFELDLYAEIYREASDGGCTMGVNIREKATNNRVCKLDIEIQNKRPIENKIYLYNGINIKGVLPKEILADKIFLLSIDNALRRTKDMVDIYALSQCVGVYTFDILDICEKKGRKIGDFNVFFNRQSELEHAYVKLLGVVNKPSFQEVYSHLKRFIFPFVERNNINQFWEHKNQIWL
jgi:hypothetical protein